MCHESQFPNYLSDFILQKILMDYFHCILEQSLKKKCVYKLEISWMNIFILTFLNQQHAATVGNDLFNKNMLM